MLLGAAKAAYKGKAPRGIRWTRSVVDLEIATVTHDLTRWRNTSNSSSVLLIIGKFSRGFDLPHPFVDPLGCENRCNVVQVVVGGR
jgi:hypothetical protein